MNILLIEPDVVLSATYQAALERAGHKVVSAGTAQAAIQAADTSTPELVVLELQLVSHSGVEFLYEFRSYSEWEGVPVLVLSHVPIGEFAQSWSLLHEGLGVGDYLYKPHTTLAALQRAVNKIAVAATL